MHHPHIVPIFGVGCEQGIHYYAMQFVDGRSLAAVIHESRCSRSSHDGTGGDAWSVPGASVTTEDASASSAERLDDDPEFAVRDEPGAIDRGDNATSSGGATPGPGARRAHRHRRPGPSCRSIRAGISSAMSPGWASRQPMRLDHAHGLGILHRDIKPANLLIDPHGAAWITDFGLARLPSDFSLTGTNDVVGTLRYMSPEQAQARRGVVDQRTDIYSLGVTLYELLTLRPAFEGRDHQELLRQIATEEPVTPRRLNRAIPRDLETIVLKAMAKDPSHRYGTAQELAADLGRFLADEPILARRPGLVERTLRWARRHWEIVATAAAVVMVSLAISTTLIWAQAPDPDPS